MSPPISPDRQRAIDYIDRWDRILREDLNHRQSKLSRMWEIGHLMCRDTDAGARRGNVVSDFADSLTSRFLVKNMEITAQPFHPDHAEYAQDFTNLADSLYEITGLLDRLQSASMNAVWGAGWIYVGHPLDNLSLFVDKRMNAPDSTSGMGIATPDEWVEESQETMDSYGVEADDLEEAEPSLVEAALNRHKSDPKPVLPTDFGLPWLKTIDPRYIVHSRGAASLEDCEYIAVLHFLSRKELATVVENLPEYLPIPHSDVKCIWEMVEEKQMQFYPELTCIVEVFVRHDKNDPEYSWHRFAYPYATPESYLYLLPNPHGKFVPLVNVKLKANARIWDRPIAASLANTANNLDVTYQALDISIKREQHNKYWTSKMSGLDPDTEKNLNDPNYEGSLPINDPINGVKKLEGQFNEKLLQAALYYRTMAQVQTGQSDMDRGQAIKGITARQTDVLVSASGINVQAMGVQMGKSTSEVLFKLIYLITRYGKLGQVGNMNIGRLAQIFNRGNQDITTSMLYKVRVQDAGINPTVEDALAWTQFLRVGDTAAGALIMQNLDPRWLTKMTLQKYGYGPEGIRPPAPAPVPGNPMGQPGFSGNMPSLGGADEAAMVDMQQGQHPERLAGDRGLDMQNMKSGMMRIGSGSGEGE